MEDRRIGGLQVSALGLGCAGLTGYYGPPQPPDQALALIRDALDRGVTLLDTADVVGEGANEHLVGRALRARRDEVTVATKFGSFTGVSGRPEAVRRACEDSLRRLGVETIDLWYQFRVDPAVPVEDTWGAMSEQVAAGKVRYLGICEAAPQTIRRAHAVHPVSAVQSEYSLWTRDPESDGVLALAAEIGAGFVACCPLGRRALTGTLCSPQDLAPEDTRRRNPRFSPETFEPNRAAIERLRPIARAKGATMAQLALAWLLGCSEGLVAVPGTTRADHLAENLVAARLRLTEADRAEIETALPRGFAQGARYSDLSYVAQ